MARSCCTWIAESRGRTTRTSLTQPGIESGFLLSLTSGQCNRMNTMDVSVARPGWFGLVQVSLLGRCASLVEFTNTLNICFSIFLVGKELLADCVDEKEDRV